MGIWILMMFTMDFARFAKPEDEKYHIGVTFGWALLPADVPRERPASASCSCSTFGITFDELAGQESALPVKIVNLTGILGLALIAITQFRINTVNLYLASTNLQSFFSRLHLNSRARSGSIVACVICYLLMLTNIFSYVLDALNYQGIVIVAWVAVALAHVVYLRRTSRDAEHAEFRPGRIPALQPRRHRWPGPSRASSASS